MLGTLVNEKKSRWADYLPEMVHAYNNTVHNSTGYTPSYLMFGRHACAPVDILLGGPLEEPNTVGEWVKKHHERLYFAYKRAGELNAGAGQQQKRQHDGQGVLGPLMIGERVLVRNVGSKGQGKLANFWHSIPCVVVKQPNPDIPVYVVKPEKGGGKEKVLHRKLLRPCPLLLQAPAQEEHATSEPAGHSPSTLWMLPPTRWLPPWQAVAPSTTSSGEEAGAVGPEGLRRSQRSSKGIPPQRYGDG